MPDPGALLAMTAPNAITDDAVLAKDWCDELGDTAVAAISEHAFVLSTYRFDF